MTSSGEFEYVSATVHYPHSEELNPYSTNCYNCPKHQETSTRFHTSLNMTEFISTWKQPSHPTTIQVVKGAPYQSSARSLVSLPAGALFSKITTAIPVAHKTYTSVQSGIGLNIELCSDLVYCNHSCSPSLEFDMSKFEVRVSRDRPLSVGDELTFFYPSTEWNMVQPFRCNCRSEKCLGVISGSESLAGVRKQYWLNEHIVELAAKEISAIDQDVRDEIKVGA